VQRFPNLPQSQLSRLQLVINSSPLAVSKTPKFAHITQVLKSLHWLKIEQRIQYKVAYITYQVLQSEQHSYLHSLLIMFNLTVLLAPLTSPRPQRPLVRSRLKVTDRSNLPTVLLYFGILYPNNCGSPCASITRHCY